MSDKILGMLGLMRRANAVAIGETNTGSSAVTGKAKIIFTASDASENACHRAEGFAHGRGIPVLQLPYCKSDISEATGLPGCSMLAVEDSGFGAAFLQKLMQEHESCRTEENIDITERLAAAGRKAASEKKSGGRINRKRRQ